MNGYPRELVQRQIGRPGEGWIGPESPAADPIRVDDPDSRWPSYFAAEASRLRVVLGPVAKRIEHVGSTSVPGLPAKPIVDIDVWVDETDDEDQYVPALARIGYVLVLREPWWNGHRMFQLSSSARFNVHLFPATAPEPLRHLLFRDWLRAHPADRDMYAATKRTIADRTRDDPEKYNLAKNEVIDEIYARIFAAPPTDHPALR